MFCFDTAGFALIQLFLQTSDSYTVQMTQHLNFFTILTFWGQKGQTQGPQTKLCLQIWNQRPKISIIPNLEGPTLKNKNFKIFTFRGSGGPVGGPKYIFFNWYEIRAPKLVWYQFLKVLHRKTKILKFWPFGARGAKTGGPNQNFSTDMKSGLHNLSTAQIWSS